MPLEPFEIALLFARAAIGLCAFASAAVAAPVELRDDAGHVVRLSAPAQRIVSLAPHATELLFVAGAGERIVGVVDFSDHPPAARTIERVGGSRALDLERIARSRPDLVVAWQSGNGERQIQALRSLGLAVYENEPRTLDDIPRTIEALGRLAGTSAQARTAADAFRGRLATLRARYTDRAPVTVFHQVWSNPLLTVNREHLIDDVITLCGGRNVFAGLPALTPSVTVEAVLRANPEVITAAAIDAEEERALVQWRRWPGLAATLRGNFVRIHPDLLSRHTPRILDGAEQVCEGLEQARRRRGGRDGR